MSGLTKAQRAMLDDIAATERGVLYVRRFSRYGRTVEALEKRGFVVKVEPDHSTIGMDGWSLAPSAVPATECPICHPPEDGMVRVDPTHTVGVEFVTDDEHAALHPGWRPAADTATEHSDA
jgi:hypothetical protein